MIKKIFKTIYFLLIPVIIFMVLGFAIDANKSSVCNSFSVNIDYSCGNFFIDNDQVKEKVYNRFDTVSGVPFNQASLSNVKSLITEMTYVRNANVYKTIEGKIKADITQRKPLVRIVNNNGSGFYIDTDGKLLPLYRDYTARVIIFNGESNINYYSLIDLTEISNYENEYDQADIKLLKDIYEIASYINRHKFLKAFIDYVHFTTDGYFELIPKNGSHVVEFGTTENMEQKFYKLMTFYNHGLTKIGWNNYKKINLEYKNQVICSK